MFGICFWVNLKPAWAVTAQTWEKDQSLSGDIIDDTEVYAGKMYVSTRDLYPGPVTMTLYVKNGTDWSTVDITPIFTAGNTQISKLTVFDGKLIAGTYNSAGAEVWSYDGSSWVRLSSGGNGDANNYWVKSMVEFRGSLYVGYDNLVDGCEVWMYSNSSWVAVNTPGFGDVLYQSIRAMAVHQGDLYAGSGGHNQGVLEDVRIFKYLGGITWQQINTDGFGTGDDSEAISMISYNGELFVGSNDDSCPKIRHTNAGSTLWSVVTPEGLCGLSNYVTDLAVYNNKLVASFSNGKPLLLWNGMSWTVPGNYTDKVSDYLAGNLEVYNGRLYSLGSIDTDHVTMYHWFSVGTSSVYRFWNNTSHHHFYTVSAFEKDFVIQHYPEWTYEGVAYATAPNETDGLMPVHRFWSERYRCHFYTISEKEKKYVINNLSHDWTYEGIAFYASPEKDIAPNSVYRFWSNKYKSHFYTLSANERDEVIQNLSHDWSYEGIAYYVF